ncbi:UNVERIFIED_ORG: amino acid transporter [Rhizobium etli]|uniref:Aminoacid/polyamine transporter protein n=1 Tax=Rhizobium etli bv. mimosae str. IE4771 TaxID=1432050 RepID=A0A060IJ84_RHIET|nr:MULTISPECIES: APC family permease [Rhizobium]AJC83551.1 aminoacid/polyamine transporter protein [Rhizobium etli bv. phaseoli str. IE4803]UWU37033.1 APC family permease [Rhizobium leguminosarum bv. phaseoli]AIC31591.1 aminoacid/polyamine transporter protein [Rhizobium sp. IE4771]ARQ62333.1 aminoacid/polyamine transporter protein [Rhizobium sp. Kim5]RSB85771.1 APC family permease [Rhizobium sophoriradicis]
MNLSTLMFGRRLANREHEDKKIGWVEAVPAIGLDGLGSSSYGPEAALTVLIPLGALGLVYIGPVMGCIVALLAILYFSYRQTLAAYPTNGGAYVVAKENLGEYPSLLAAAALMIDYVLNVAVGVSAGVGALVSAIPSLHPYIVPLCLAIVFVVMLANLRGTGEAGWLFALPTYLFIICFLGAIAYGLVGLGLGEKAPVVAPPPLGPAAQGATLWLLMHAFASGCTAMTGVEAVSNGMGSFRQPVMRNAYFTLTIIVVVLGLLLGGVATIATAFEIGAMDQTREGYQSVLSQLLAAIAGHGAFYYIAMASLLSILCLSANTSFVGFPRLCQMVAADGYLPKAFAQPGRRLVFTAGILFLSGFAALLLIAFGGITDNLIPLFAIGAFLTFTISQAGMTQHWRRRSRRYGAKLAINAVGAVSTAAALVIILIAKFAEGAWITLVAVPVAIAVLKMIKSYYISLQRELRKPGPITLEDIEPPTVLVITEAWNRLSERAIKFALTISPDVVAVHFIRLGGPDREEGEKALREKWRIDVEEPIAALGLRPPRLMLIPAPYRQLHQPLLRLVEKLDADSPERRVAVLIPETVKDRWWQKLLHMNRAGRLRTKLVKLGGPRLTVATVPWRLYREEPPPA